MGQRGAKFQRGQKQMEKRSRRCAMERNCPPLLLSIIWESNVSPPRHPREAFRWPEDAREKEGGEGKAGTKREDAKRERERRQIDTCTREWNPGTECDGNESTDGGD